MRAALLEERLDTTDEGGHQRALRGIGHFIDHSGHKPLHAGAELLPTRR